MASELEPSFEFDRYVNGTLMAEGVTIERASMLDKAMVAAARIAPKGPNGETPVLVYRPAPAATDTGLETVAKVDSHLGDMSRLSIIDRPLSIGTEVCLRSQAVELLAAERARYVEASQRATNEESLKDTMHRGLLRWKERAEKAEADNAAQAARIKAETELREDHQKRNKELEAKLAAAEKALEFYADVSKYHAPFTGGFGELYYDCGEKARAVLGGKPS